MDDDIDIEEHDVMDNPLIKKIFPDISIIKKEIQGYFEEVGPLPQIKEEKTDRPIPIRELLTFEDEIPETENKSFASESSSSTRYHMDITSIEESTSTFPKYNNKIILGSKPNHNPIKHNINRKCQQINQICSKKAKVYNTNIVLQDVSSYLMRSNRYCKVCFILFSSKYDLTEHHKKEHFVTDTTVLAKKDKLKCSFCDNLFSSYSDLFLHCNNVHDNSSQGTNTYSHNIFRGNDEKHENGVESGSEKACQDTNVSNNCFHCGNRFGSQQSLIDHLYNILQPDKFRCKVCAVNFSSQIKLNEHKTIHNETNVLDKTRQSDTFVSEDTKDMKQMQQFYKCYICSSYYTKMKCYSMHLSRNHKKQFDLSTHKKSVFDSHCKFCSTKSSNAKSYNSHVAKYHQAQLKLKNIAATRAEEFAYKSDFELSNTITISDRVTNEILEGEELEKEDKYESNSQDTLVLKSTIFKCGKCDVHFLSAKDAAQHKNHIEILINWKCFICLKIFKDKDKTFHEKQHSFSKSLTVYDLTEDTLSRVLYNCTLCTIHFTEDNFLFHYPICGLGLRTSVYCNFCDILIDKNSNTYHENAHMKFHVKTADFIIVQSDVLMIGNSNNKQTNNISQNSAANSSNAAKLTNTTIESSSTHELKELNKDGEYSGGFQRYIGKLNESKEYQRPNKTKQILKRKRPDSETMSDIDTDSGSSSTRINRVSSTHERKELDEAGKYRGDFQRLFDKLNEKKEYHRPNKSRKQKVKRKKADSETVSDIDTDSGSSSKKFKTDDFKLSYCASCKCFINKNYVRNVHRESNCSRIITYVCEYCGLLLTDNSLSHHKRLHKKKKNLKLQDFKFYDLGDGKRIRPPIPSLPKCNNCHVHFVQRNAIKTHLCENVEFLTCHLCDVKLIEPAFKIHMPFHKYSLEKPIHHSALTKSQSFQTQNESEKYSSKAIDVQMNPAVVTTNKVETSLKIIYLCKCCTTAVNTYDEVVEHCQKHYSQREFRAPTKTCTVCNLKFEANTYSEHVFNHKDCNVSFNVLKFDENNFLLDNDAWINHIFGSIPRDETEEILKRSIYKFEKRLKMEIIQEGCPNFTEYKCFKCAKFVESFSVFNHTQKNCSRNRYPCSICGLPFATLKAKDFHEKIHTLHPSARAKSYRIVLFKWDCRTLNKLISGQSKQYILYQCRNCNGLIDKSVFKSHICSKLSLQKCHNCGLLLYKEDYKTHNLKHKKMDSFVSYNMKVVLLGKRPDEKEDEKLKQIATSSFEGIVCDYTLYKCSECSICVKKGEILNHVCIFDYSKTKCEKCDLYFEKNRFNSHCLAHESDTEFTPENMDVVLFNPKKESQIFLTSSNSLDEHSNSKILAAENSKTDKNIDEKKEVIQNEINAAAEQTAKLFKCKCGLHYLNKSNLLNHSKNCGTKIRISKQNCSKCDLVFTPNELFNHLLSHHGNTQYVYKFDIEEYRESGDTVDIIK